MKMNKIVVSLLAAGVMTSPLAHATNGYFSHGYSMKAKGMAGAGIALPQDSIAAATNPAGMVMIGDRVDLGLDLFKPSRGADIAGNGAGLDGTYSGNGKSNFFIPEFGYNKMIDPNMSLGVSVFGNGGMNTEYASSPFAAFGGTSPAGVNLEQLFIAPTWAMKVNSQHSIGVAVNLVRQTFSATGLEPFAGGGGSAYPSSVTNNGTDTSTGVGFRLGWTGELTSMVTMGATYQPKTKMSKFSKYAGLFADAGSFDIPANYGLGIAVKPTPETTVAADYEVIQYGGVPAIANTNTTGQLGTTNGGGFGWTNVKVIKLGVSQMMSDALTVRAGYSHNTQPIQPSQTMFNILAPGAVQDHLTLGATWNVSRQNEITVAYMHAFEKKVNGAGSISVPQGGGEANIHMYENSLGVAYSWKM
jgi:long-chain fatty acid transport protein